MPYILKNPESCLIFLNGIITGYHFNLDLISLDKGSYVHDQKLDVVVNFIIKNKDSLTRDQLEKIMRCFTYDHDRFVNALALESDKSLSDLSYQTNLATFFDQFDSLSKKEKEQEPNEITITPSVVSQEPSTLKKIGYWTGVIISFCSIIGIPVGVLLLAFKNRILAPSAERSPLLSPKPEGMVPDPTPPPSSSTGIGQTQSSIDNPAVTPTAPTSSPFKM